MVTKIGTEFLVNTQTADRQDQQSIAVLSDGGFILSWTDKDYYSDLSPPVVKAQLYNAEGMRVGGEFMAPTTTFMAQMSPSAAGLANGGFALVWEDQSGTPPETQGGQGIRGRIFKADGTGEGNDFLINAATSGGQHGPAATGLSNGSFVVAWTETLPNGTAADVRMQIVSSTGVKLANDIVVNSTLVGYQSLDSVTALSGGGFVVSWTDDSKTLGDDQFHSVKAQVFDASGSKVGTEFLVNTEIRDVQQGSSLAALSNGGFVATWYDKSGTLGDSSAESVKAQIFDASGHKVGTEFLVNTQTFITQAFPSVAGLPDGRFIVAWYDDSGLADGSGSNIKAQVFEANGSKVGGEFLVNTNVEGRQWNPVVATLPDGKIVISWTDLSGTLGDDSSGSIKAQIFSLDDVPPPDNNLETDGAPVSGTVTYFESFDTITSSDPGQPVSLILTDAGPLDLSDELGTTGAAVRASAGGNTITTGAGADTLTQIFSDLQPGATVTFRGGAGLDTLDLSAGTLTAFTSTIDPDGAVRFTAGGRTVIVSDVERFVINGSNVSDVFQGSQGGDSLNGKGGADTYNGSAGDDSYVFSNAGDTVTGERSSGGIDTIWSTITVDLRNESAVENLRLQGSAAIDGTGNNLANTITGNSASNVIVGGLGNDKLYGKGGADAFVFAERYSAHQDAILDFDADDTIILDGAVFQSLDKDGDGILDAGALQFGSVATGTGATLVYRAFNGLLSYDADGAGIGGAAAIATIGKSLLFLDAGDIRIKGQTSTIAGQDTGSVTEDGVLIASGTLTIADVDAGQRAFRAHEATAPLQGTFGTLEIDAQGRWTYKLDNGDADVQALGAGDTETDSITVAAVDGTEHEIVVTIGGAADGPATPLTATFEELGSESLYNMYIPDNYLGFAWSSVEGYFHNGYFVDLYVAGFDYSASKTDKFMYNGHGGRTSSLVRSDGSDFGVTGLDIADGTLAHLQESTSSLDANTVRFVGYRDGAVVATKLATLSNDHFDRIAFNADFADIDRFEIVATGGSGSTANPGAGWWSIDNIGFLV